MKVFETAEKLRIFLDKIRRDNKKIGFVPTMGALHNGHMSLIDRAMQDSDFIIASIFVNPTQFGQSRDLSKYPRTVEQDLNMLEAAGCHAVYVPLEDDIYPDGTELVEKYDIGFLETVLEGASRPGHYQGVCQVVERLLRIVEPTHLFLGQKDYQQVLVLKQMIFQKELPVEVVICPIVREVDGLAMSSRNRRLTKPEREAAPIISQTLFKCKQKFKDFSITQLERWAIANINAHYLLDVDYLKFHDADNLALVETKKDAESFIVLTAVHIGEIRLIDNVVIA